MENHIKSYGIKNDFQVIPNVVETEKEQVAHFMRKSDFLVLPSLCETFGVVIIETFDSGISIVANECGPTQEIINKDVGVLVPPANANKVANGINHMLDNYLSYSQENMVRYANENYSKEVIARKLNNVYKNICKK